MLTGRRTRALSALMALVLLAAACSQRDDDEGAGDTETGGGDTETAQSDIPTEDCGSDPTVPIEGDTIRLVSSFPQSGLTAAFSEIARGWKAYFDQVNADGGVEIDGTSYQIEYDDMDDEYDAAQTTQNIQELVGTDGSGAFATFSVVGTANNVAIRDFLGDLCVPNVFAATGSPAWGNPDYPWTIGSTLAPYTLEGQLFAQVLAEEDPDATVAMLLQDDDFGDAYEEGFMAAIEGTDIEVVATERYETGANEVAAQVTSLASSDATAFFDGGTLLACPDALSQAASQGWEPITWVSSTCTSKTLMGLAGEAADGVYSATNLMDPLNPEWTDDPAIAEVQDAVTEFQGEGELDLENAIIYYGWTQAAVFVQGLEAAEAPTRLAVMESLHNLDGIEDAGVLLPGVSVTTSADDPYMGETVNIQQYTFEGEGGNNHFEFVGDLLSFEGEAGSPDITPDDLING